MIKLMRHALLVCLLALTSCGGGGGSGESSSCDYFKIINGEECRDATIPTVKLLINSPKGEGGCTGTLVSNDYILTAAHCVSEATSIRVIHDYAEAQAANWYWPRSYVSNVGTPANSRYDIALVLAPSFGSATGVKSPSFSVSTPVVPGEYLNLVGFGKDGTGQDLINPRGTSVKVIEVANGLILSLFNETNSGACQGDSGGALLRDGAIVGIVSIGSKDCGQNGLTIFTSTQSSTSLAFLTAVTNQLTFE